MIEISLDNNNKIIMYRIRETNRADYHLLRKTDYSPLEWYLRHCIEQHKSMRS